MGAGGEDVGGFSSLGPGGVVPFFRLGFGLRGEADVSCQPPVRLVWGPVARVRG